MEVSQLPKDDFGGFWRRFLATTIDLVILLVPISFVELELQARLDGTEPGTVKPSFFVQFIAVYGTWAIYEIPFWASPWRGTPGKRICGLLVTDILAPSNYALQRSVTGLSERAARVQKDFTLAARWPRIARPAQRGR